MEYKLKTFPVLYKKSSKNKIQTWKISVEQNDDNTAFYCIEFGYLNGKIQKTIVKINSGKNLGKSNETSPYEQGILEANSKFLKQKDKSYVENLDDFDNSLKPMLAHKYQDHKKKIVWPIIVQPKLDGCRCLSFKVENKTTMLSREGKVFSALTHIQEELERLLPEGLVLDGELYCHGYKFEEIISWIKREQPETAKINLVVYDVLDLSLPYAERFAKFTTWLAENKPKYIKSITSKLVKNEDELNKSHDDFVEQEYEGLMIRNRDCMYKAGGRSMDLLKLKAFEDAEYEIVGAEENKGKHEGQCTLILKTVEGKEFGCKPKGDEAKREWYWENWRSLVGKMMTVRYFELTSDGIPRFPVGLKIKDELE